MLTNSNPEGYLKSVVPRWRGDDPFVSTAPQSKLIMFPAYAGISKKLSL
jgi:hypothetical protein